MGQYYSAVVIGENGDIKSLCPHDFGNNAKLMEFSWCGNDFVNAVLSRIHNKKAKVAFIGDYAKHSYEENDGDFFTSHMPKKEFLKIYRVAFSKSKKHCFKKSQFTSADLELMDTETSGTYLVNHDNKEFLDIGAYLKEARETVNNEVWAVNPLPLLTACGNGLGRGDFYSNSFGCENVGVWAFATLEYTEKIPEGYMQAHYIFKV
jgi:hypothetical protein